MARQKFGQHFLKDSNWKQRIVEYFKPSGMFAEIGPGQGAITKILASKFENFYAFEIDSSLLNFHEDQSRYQVLFQDFLDWDFQLNGELVRNFSLIGNLPYESGTQIVLKVTQFHSQVPHFVFMLQKEVADRIAASPGSRDFGSLSVLVQSYYDIKLSPKIPPEAFSPPPKVDSAVIIGTHRENQLDGLDTKFQDFLRLCFQQKRKRLRNNLKVGYDAGSIDRVFQKIGFSEDKRAEEVDVESWHLLYRLFQSESPAS